MLQSSFLVSRLICHICKTTLVFVEFVPRLPLRESNGGARRSRGSPRYRRFINFGGIFGGGSGMSSRGLSSVVKELAQLTYTPRSSQTISTSTRRDESRNEVAIGGCKFESSVDFRLVFSFILLAASCQSCISHKNKNILVLAELLTYSDCQSAGEPLACGFGEYAAPRRSDERDVVLTALAATLLCEEAAASAFICGPVEYLADIIPRTSRTHSSHVDMLQFVSWFSSVSRVKLILVALILIVKTIRRTKIFH